ncbi:MAG: hypothetical protein ACI3ZD_06195 [Prevotella sp.]
MDITQRPQANLAPWSQTLENFGSFEYIDKEDSDAVRHVRICPLYAMSSLFQSQP